MIHGGYILQPRKIDESEVFKMAPVVRELWQYLLRRVNHKDNDKYKRGQGFFCLSDIQDDLCWYVGYRKERYSKPQLTKSLRKLCEGNMIETTKATRGVIITILNYNYYQNPENYEGNDEGNTKETRRKREGHTKNKNVKNVKNERMKETTPYGGDEKFYTMKELNALAVKYLSWNPIMSPGRAEALRPLTDIFKDDVERGFRTAAANGKHSVNYVISVASSEEEKDLVATRKAFGL